MVFSWSSNLFLWASCVQPTPAHGYSLALFQIGVLPEIVRAVQGRVEVYLDGGVRLGTDVFKALALGARAVFVGRPALWGLAYQVSYFIFMPEVYISVETPLQPISNWEGCT